MPQQNTGEQGPDEYAAGQEQDNYEPEPKRRRMRRTEEYHSPPVQASNAQAVKKARRAKGDADLPAPQFQVDESATNKK